MPCLLSLLLSPQVACMQFINIVVHSVENMNFRVFLQYEFTHLGLDQYLEVGGPVPPRAPAAAAAPVSVVGGHRGCHHP